jgi:hypothetical protein
MDLVVVIRGNSIAILGFGIRDSFLAAVAVIQGNTTIDSVLEIQARFLVRADLIQANTMTDFVIAIQAAFSILVAKILVAASSRSSQPVLLRVHLPVPLPISIEMAGDSKILLGF